ncbi:SoxR reducing system RseC family protein [Colwellia sp. D2M02]|uniref:SoxR reducing system RseC family protein n=1 Tax=Colwellia sp. D2M02 TaxID=2841562 RepID=UPI001C095C9D|nr:SoxR reducing system RseC family protein [Colwellia sp. D2M02]MBU2894440.1 SoxR reducing system RseC family protein [Colwellia sp. D2M02]
MIEELVDVVAITDNSITLTSQVKSSCGSCAQVKSCASGQVAKAIPQRKLKLVLPYVKQQHGQLQVGDSVVLGLPEVNVLTSAGQVYLFPLIGLAVFSGLGEWLISQQLLPHELLGLSLGIFGGYLGYRLAKYYQNKSHQSAALQPRILRKLIANVAVNSNK